MALAQHLPIYKLASDLCSLAADLTKNMRREFKRTLGEKLLTECIEVTIQIFRANTAEGRDRVQHIQQILERIQVIELMLRLALDKQLIGANQYARTVEITDPLGRQATGWKKHAATSPAA
ncbi:MAG: four helix bundle protein [Pseudomonas sp.]|uniref:four helix bundle protein n=1 Tax=Pseudomonas sp. TaxID=306 RepID=UPI002735654F|nr:four helix bundle protein [Pseudomonas sp.]MDP3848591.1 four helix bundle protein [Pseudomonas sp.]